MTEPTQQEETTRKSQWNNPKTGAIIGFTGGLWIGFLGRLTWAEETVAWSELALYALGAAVIFCALGWCFPRVVSIALYPFSLFGFGGS